MTLIDKINESKYIRPVTNALLSGSLIALLNSVAVNKADARTITIDETVKIELVNNRMTQADASRVYNYAKKFLYEQGRYDKTIESFQNIIDYYGKDMVDDCLYWIGKCQFNIGYEYKAHETLAKIIYMYPNGNVMQNRDLQKTLVDMIEELDLHNPADSGRLRSGASYLTRNLEDRKKYLDWLFELLEQSEDVSKDVRLRTTLTDIIKAGIKYYVWGLEGGKINESKRFEVIKDLIIYGKKAMVNPSAFSDLLFDEVEKFVDKNDFNNAVHYAKLLEYVGCNQLFENAKQKIDLMLNANDIVFKNTYHRMLCGYPTYPTDSGWDRMSNSEREIYITRLAERKIHESPKLGEIKSGLSGEVNSYFKFFNLTQDDLDYIVSKMQMEIDVGQFGAIDQYGYPTREGYRGSRSLVADVTVKCTINIREIVEYKVGDPYSWVKIEPPK